jgi:hypothetical protein
VIGARVIVVAGERTWLRDLSPNGSFLSAHDPRLLFGLGQRDSVDRIEVRWPDGTSQRIEAPEADRYLVVTKGAPGDG